MVLQYIAFPVEGLVWGLPMWTEKKLYDYRHSSREDKPSKDDAAIAEGFLGGLYRLHHLISAMEYELPQTEHHERQLERERSMETYSDRLARKTKTTTALIGAAGYVAATVALTPWAIAPLIVSNILDIVLVHEYPREVFDDPYSGV